jgi:hypothetical protein
MWGPRGQYIPFGTLAFAPDGGIILAPADVTGARWRYGELRLGEVPVRPNFSEVFVKPKLHYHQSGRVSASLGGTRLPPRAVQYPPLAGLQHSQILGLTVVRPWELTWASKQPRVGDIGTRERSWPQVVGWSIGIIDHPSVEQSRVVLSPGGRGLIGGDKQRAALDLREFGRNSLLIARIHLDYDPTPDLQTSITAAAYPVVENGVPQRSYVLWSSTARNPLLAYEDPSEFATRADLDDLSRFRPVYDDVVDRRGQ